MTGSGTPQDLQRGTSAVVIARHIRNDIESGKLPHEQQLPSTRVLAERWGTSVATINRAMALLAEEGIVVNRARSSRIVNYPGSALGGTRATVVLIGGYAGSGKSELGRILARATGWALLDKDTTTRAVVEAALEMIGRSPHDRESETYLSVVRPAEYESLIAAMTENLQCGNSVILTAPFIRELADRAWCDRIAASVSGLNANLQVVWIHCDAETMRTYIKHRGAARDATKMANWESYLESVNPDFKPAIKHRIVENSAGSRPLQDQASELLGQMSK
jgi:predicted kinase